MVLEVAQTDGVLELTLARPDSLNSFTVELHEELAKALKQARREEIAAICERAGLVLSERQFEQLCATAPYIDAMVGRLHRQRPLADEPMNVFQFPDR